MSAFIEESIVSKSYNYCTTGCERSRPGLSCGRANMKLIVLLQDVSVGGSTCGRANMKLIRTLLDELAGEPFVGRTVDVLGDMMSSQKTPVRFPSLLSKFRCVC